MAYWLLKSEPDAYSIDDLERDGTTPWDEIRNYQARNLIRDQIQVGDKALIYQSACAEPGVTGVAEVVGEAYPDPLQFNPDSRYYDAKSDPENPRWYCMDVRFKNRAKTFLSLREIKSDPKLMNMVLVKHGRLSVQPVTATEWKHICKRCGMPSS